MEQVNVAWKYAAIIVSFLLILETLAVVGLMKWGYDTASREEACANNICIAKGATSYQFDSYTQTCTCLNEYGRVIHSERME